jgi:hypothetical protein
MGKCDRRRGSAADNYAPSAAATPKIAVEARCLDGVYHRQPPSPTVLAMSAGTASSPSPA